MKKYTLFTLISVVIFFATTQITKSQTFELGTTVRDRSKVNFIDSLWLSLSEDSILFDVTKIDSITNVRTIDPNMNNSGAGNSSVLSISPNPYPYYTYMHPHIPNQFTINTNMKVGEIPIQHNVTANGTTTYSVPIECAPGRAGVQPTISLCYNSLGSNGVLGYGWGIGGLSSIKRTTSNIYYDNIIKPIEMTASAKFVMDGTRLLQTASTTTVRTFAPEQGNVIIEAYMSGDVTKYFKVWYSNGSTAIYGYENNTSNKLLYPITKMTDNLGNTVKFEYDDINNNYYVNEIKYGSSKTITNDFASIKFYYKTRSDVICVYEAGLEITENRLVDYIQCINNNIVFRTYSFTYTTNKVALLTQIDCSLTNGSLNPLKFYYGTNNLQTQFISSTSQLSNWQTNTPLNNLIVNKAKLDILNDENTLIIYPYYNPYIVRLPGHPDSFYESEYPSNLTLRVYPNLWQYRSINSDSGFIELTAGDVDWNEEGEVLIKINNTVFSLNDRITFSLYKNEHPSNGYLYPYKTVSYTPNPALNYNSTTPKAYILGDFAGYGKSQILAATWHQPLGTNNATKIMVFDINSPTPLCNTTVSGFNYKEGDILFAMDYDGDGRSELCHIHDNGTDIYAFSNNAGLSITKVTTISDLKKNTTTNMQLMVGDINGDGKTDLLLSPALNSNSNQWSIYYSKGINGFNKTTQSLVQYVQSYNGTTPTFILHDVNNDGRADLVFFGQGNAITLYPAMNTGFSTTTGTCSYTLTNSNARLFSTASGCNYNIQLMALDNSGNIEKLTLTMNDTRERMMSASVSSLGIVTKSEYQNFDNNNAPYIYEKGYAPSLGFPYQNLNGNFWATSETQKWYKNVQKTCDSYYYKKAIIHHHGLGFLGFTTFSTNDIRNNIFTQTFEPMNYGVLKIIELPNLKKIEYTYFIDFNFNKTAIVRPTQQKVTDLLTNNIITTNYLTYDSYSQPTSIETEYGAGSGVKTKREYVYNNTNTGTGSTRVFVLGLPSEEIITNTRSNSSWIDKTSINYNASKLPYTKTTYTGTSGTLQTAYETFEYDSEGNLTSHTFKPYSASTTHLTSYTYDTTNKRFLKTETDHMGRITTYDVYDGFGRLTSVKNYLNQSTTFEYDELNRQIKTVTPDGVTSQTTFAWNSSNNGSVLSITSTATKRPASVQYLDAFGRTTRESVAGFNGTYINTDYNYDQYERLYQKSAPYTSSPQYTTYEYDGNDRLWKITLPSGRQSVTTYSGNTVTTVDAGMTTTKTYDASGALLQGTDPGGTIAYNLRPDGQPSKITVGNVVTSFEYDTYGRQTKITDPSAGIIQYQYDAEGLLYKQINARNQTTTYLYNNFGQPLTVTTPEQTINYTYDSYKRLTKITAGAHYEISYGYDALGRVNKETEKEGTVTFVKDYTFDAGRVYTVTYNNVAADKLTYNYNAYGHLNSMQFGTTTIYTVNSRNNFGQLTNYTYGNGVATARTYSAYGSPMNIVTSKSGVNLVNASYNFNDATGLLDNRTDIVGGGGQENFTYDNMQRLKTYKSGTINYNTAGNITYKPDAGNLEYTNSSRPYQITGQTDLPANLDTDLRTATYTSGERPATITKSGKTATFSYNHANERTKMAVSGTGAYTRIYLGGNYEHEVSGSTTTERLYLGGTPYSAPAVAIRTNSGAWELNYIHRDYLGSIIAVSNSSGSAVETRSYDAWGRLRNPSNLQPYAYNAQPSLLLKRGYTGHEHLPEFGLLNMNARLYDPVIGRFISPDPYVQDPDFSQSFNRYAYSLNNPLLYTDPDGEFIVGFIAGLIRGIFTLNKPLKHAWQTGVNEMKIYGGMFAADKNKNFFGQAWEIISRHTWQVPQTVIGHTFALTSNYAGQVDKVQYYGGATVLSGNYWGQGDGAAVTLGSYITGGINLETDPNNSLFQHEYGHYLQSQSMGWGYLFEVGIPSLKSANNNDAVTHNGKWFEQHANKKAYEYFYKKIGEDLIWDSSNEILDKNWLNMIHSKYGPRTSTMFAMPAMTNPTRITPATSNYFNWSIPSGFIYQGIDDDYIKYNRTSIDRLRILLSLYK